MHRDWELLHLITAKYHSYAKTRSSHLHVKVCLLAGVGKCSSSTTEAVPLGAKVLAVATFAVDFTCSSKPGR